MKNVAPIGIGEMALGVGKAEDNACDYKSLKRSIAPEVAKYGITVNCVAPESTQNGWINEAFEDAVLPVFPFGKLIQPQDIAETNLFL